MSSFRLLTSAPLELSNFEILQDDHLNMVICPSCLSPELIKKGISNNQQRYHCKACSKSFLWKNQIVKNFCITCFSNELSIKRKNKNQCLTCKNLSIQLTTNQIDFLREKKQYWDLWIALHSKKACPTCLSTHSIKKGLTNKNQRLCCSLCHTSFSSFPIAAYHPIKLIIGQSAIKKTFSKRQLASLFQVSPTFITSSQRYFSEWDEATNHAKKIYPFIVQYSRNLSAIKSLEEQKQFKENAVALIKPLIKNRIIAKYFSSDPMSLRLPLHFNDIGFKVSLNKEQ
ncbi:transposase-like zinc-binding domain-containing protein [Aliivibrio wodanis]|uniref:transposase-like zinc-binding domain-containing protein n=1 Tax=Aliivibrio wodanis TaxID=80852 RepID=UPI00406C0F9D